VPTNWAIAGRDPQVGQYSRSHRSSSPPTIEGVHHGTEEQRHRRPGQITQQPRTRRFSDSSPSRKSGRRRETWGSRRSSASRARVSAVRHSRRRSGGQSFEKCFRHSPTRFEIDGGAAARQQRHASEKVRAIILPVGDARVGDVNPCRRAIDLRGQVGEWLKVRMSFKPKIRRVMGLNEPRSAPP